MAGIKNLFDVYISNYVYAAYHKIHIIRIMLSLLFSAVVIFKQRLNMDDYGP